MKTPEPSLPADDLGRKVESHVPRAAEAPPATPSGTLTERDSQLLELLAAWERLDPVGRDTVLRVATGLRRE